MNAPLNERPLAESLARQILTDHRDLQWLQPLAREYLREIGAEARPTETPHG